LCLDVDKIGGFQRRQPVDVRDEPAAGDVQEDGIDADG
jgi:hypothetical protein